MTRIAPLLLGILLSPAAFAGSLLGRTLDPDGRVRPGALGSLVGPRIGEEAEANRRSQISVDGAFRFDEIEPGSYRLVTLLTGYGAAEQGPFDVAADDVITIDLHLTLSQAQAIGERGYRAALASPQRDPAT